MPSTDVLIRLRGDASSLLTSLQVGPVESGRGLES